MEEEEYKRRLLQLQHLPDVHKSPHWVVRVVVHVFRMRELTQSLKLLLGWSPGSLKDSKLAYLLHLGQQTLPINTLSLARSYLDEIVPTDVIANLHSLPGRLFGEVIRLVYYEAINKKPFSQTSGFNELLCAPYLDLYLSSMYDESEFRGGSGKKNGKAPVPLGARGRPKPSLPSKTGGVKEEPTSHRTHLNGLPERCESTSSWQQQKMIVACICGNDYNSTSNIIFQCQGPNCGVYQHLMCVQNVRRPLPKLCYKCRVALADPFYKVSSEHGFNMQTSIIMPVEKFRKKTFKRRFRISHPVFRALFDKQCKSFLGVGALLRSDKISNRINWPSSATLRFNNRTVNIYNRNSSKELSENGRDAMVDITGLAVIGENELELETRDPRSFVLVMQLFERRTEEELKTEFIRGGIDDKQSNERVRLDESLKFMKSLFVSRNDDIATTSLVLSLKCPLSGMRMKNPIRSITCRHAKAFDEDTFINMNRVSKKWQCPHCMKPIWMHRLTHDFYLKEILKQLKDYPQISDIEINKEGQWRPFRKGHKDNQCDWNQISESYAHKQEVGELEDSEEEEEEDEAEELRKAIEAAGIKKRPRPEPEIIILSDTEEEEQHASPSKCIRTTRKPRTGNGFNMNTINNLLNPQHSNASSSAANILLNFNSNLRSHTNPYGAVPSLEELRTLLCEQDTCWSSFNNNVIELE